MTNEELVRRLRIGVLGYNEAAADRIEALTAERDDHWKSFVHWRKEADDRVEQLEAARADAKEAEAYAEELEKENTRLSGLMSERGQMLRRYDQMVVDGAKREEAWKAKLAKAVDTLMFYGGVMPNAFLPIQDGGEKARATLAEIEGEKDA